MQKGNWNKKRVYSIRKFSVGACSVLIGTCALLLGASVSLSSSVYANENAEEIVSTNRTEHQPENKETTDFSNEHKVEGVISEKSSEQPVTSENVSLKENADGSDAVVKPHADQPLVSVANTQSVPLVEGNAEVENKTEETNKPEDSNKLEETNKTEVTDKSEDKNKPEDKKESEETNKAESQDRSVSKDKQEFKSATNEVVDKLIEDRNISFNQNWHFKLNANAKEAVKPDADISSWKKMDLPHDWSIHFDFDHDSPAQNEGGQLNGGDGWYRKTFKLDEKDLNKDVRVTFDGVYMDSQVFVNGQLVGHYPNGYNQFSYDISNYLHKDGRENVISVHAVNKQPSSRWYSGSGIYRDVSLQVTDKIHVEKNGTTILTPKLESQQGGKVETQVSSRIVNTDNKDHEIVAEYQIFERGGKAVTKLVRTESKTLKAKETIHLDLALEVEKPKLWTVSSDKPALYEMVTRVYKDGQLVDAKKDLFGYRYYNWTPDQGFSLNGEHIKFHGVSLHHDHGALGAE